MLSPHAIIFPKWQNLRCMQITTGGKERDLTCVKYFSTFSRSQKETAQLKVT